MSQIPLRIPKVKTCHLLEGFISSFQSIPSGMTERWGWEFWSIGTALFIVCFVTDAAPNCKSGFGLVSEVTAFFKSYLGLGPKGFEILHQDQDCDCDDIVKFWKWLDVEHHIDMCVFVVILCVYCTCMYVKDREREYMCMLTGFDEVGSWFVCCLALQDVILTSRWQVDIDKWLTCYTSFFFFCKCVI